MSSERANGRHREVWELIPWYVNATLAAAERRRVEAHLAECRRCRREVAAQEELAEAVRAGGEEDLPPLPHRGAEQLLARLDGEAGEAGAAGAEAGAEAEAASGSAETGAAAVGARRGGASRPTPDRPRRGVPPWWLPASGLAAVLLAVAGLSLWGPATAPVDTFRTLTDDPSPVAPAAAPATGSESAAVRVRLVFAPGTSEEELRRLLLAESGSLVAGPSPYGVYTAHFARRDEARLDRLRASPLVLFAEPVAGPPDAPRDEEPR